MNFILQTVNALAFIHSQKVCHRDIKPHNIVIDAGKEIKLIDFGVAKTLNKDDLSKTTTGAKGTL